MDLTDYKEGDLILVFKDVKFVPASVVKIDKYKKKVMVMYEDNSTETVRWESIAEKNGEN